MSRLSAFIVLLAGLVFSLAAYAADGPFVRLLLSDGPHLAGKPISLYVDVLVPNFFMSPPQYPVLDIPDAVVTLPNDRALNFSQTIDGKNYSAIRRTYRIIARRGGDFTIPPMQIPLAYAAVPGQSTPAVATSPALKFTASLPEGAQTAQGTLPLEPIEITQSIAPADGKLKAGDSLIRTVTITAHNLPAMMIQPPDFEAPVGVKLYRRDPVLSDTDKNGQRVETVTYTFENSGSYTIPALDIQWYDATVDKPDIVSAPAITVAVEAAPATTPAIPPAPVTSTAQIRSVDWILWLSWAVGALMLALIGWAAIHYLPRLLAAMREHKQTREQSEQAYFQRLLSACKTNNPLLTYRALDAWARRANIRLSEINTGPADPNLEKEYRILEQAVFSPCNEQAKHWQGKKLEIALRKILKLEHSKTAPETRSLAPALNP